MLRRAWARSWHSRNVCASDRVAPESISSVVVQGVSCMQVAGGEPRNSTLPEDNHASSSSSSSIPSITQATRFFLLPSRCFSACFYAFPPFTWFETLVPDCFLCNFWARRFSLRLSLDLSLEVGPSSRNSWGAFVSSFGASLRDRLTLFSSAFADTLAAVGGAELLALTSSVYIRSIRHVH